uniref:LOB domain-containing protein n=1 Tax=Opuntia streptacantha TaxID=393608 RepID=A0A7C9DPF3_OPUST
MKKTQTSHHDHHPHPHPHPHHEPRSSSSCAACKLLKRRCGPNCIFAPYFRADEPNKFAKVHKVFGASNVGKILNEVPEEHREDAVNSLTYEAEARLRDPVYGCLGPISYLYRRMAQLQHDLALARARLARYAAEGGGGYGGGGSGSGCYNGGGYESIHECLPVMWNGFQSEGSNSNCSQLMNSVSPNSGCNGGDFGQAPLLPL